MIRVPVDRFNMAPFRDEDLIRALDWFMSFISQKDWQKRRANIERSQYVETRSTQPFSDPLTEGTLLVEKKDVIGWYLYLVDTLINEPHKYEYFPGARVIPVFKRIGMDLEALKKIEGIEKRMKDLLRKRMSEADALLFEMLCALVWVRNGYDVAFLEEKMVGKTPDLVAIKDCKTWHVECKRQSKTSDYAYRETAKRQKMITQIAEILIRRNIILDIVFHVELEPLPDTFLKDLLEDKLVRPIQGNVISNELIDVDLRFVDIPAVQQHLEKFYVKNNSPMLNALIGGRPVDNKSFTCGVLANYFLVGEGDTNNKYLSDIYKAFGVYCTCDAKEALHAKARDIKNQVYAATQQFSSDIQGVVHIGMETFDGPEVEKARFAKIQNTLEQIDPSASNLRWIFCHFFQSYSPPDQCWVFDETVSTMSPYYIPRPPISAKHLVVPEDADMADEVFHWDRPLP